MNVPRLYVATPLKPASDFALPEAAAHHVARVLRLTSGAPVVLFDGCGGEFAAQITVANRGGVRVEVGERRALERESPLSLTLVQALQAADKMDYTIQKAVELGVSRIVPVATRRCVLRLSGERADKRLAHWQQVIISACEQSGRNRLPMMEPVTGLTQWLGEVHSGGVAAPSRAPLRLILSPAGDVVPAGLREICAEHAPPDLPPVEFLVGPEGGFDDDEIRAAQQAGYRPLCLGPRVLRTETAGPAVLAAMQACWGDFR